MIFHSFLQYLHLTNHITQLIKRSLVASATCNRKIKPWLFRQRKIWDLLYFRCLKYCRFSGLNVTSRVCLVLFMLKGGRCRTPPCGSALTSYVLHASLKQTYGRTHRWNEMATCMHVHGRVFTASPEWNANFRQLLHRRSGKIYSSLYKSFALNLSLLQNFSLWLNKKELSKSTKFEEKLTTD